MKINLFKKCRCGNASLLGATKVKMENEYSEGGAVLSGITNQKACGRSLATGGCLDMAYSCLNTSAKTLLFHAALNYIGYPMKFQQRCDGS